MKSLNRRIIKSEEVKYVNHHPEKAEPVKHQVMRDVGNSNSQRVQVAPESKKMKEMFERKLQRTEQAAYERGISDGITQGKTLQKDESLHILEAMSHMMIDLAELKKNILKNAEKEIVQLTLCVAEKVLHHEVATNRDVIRNMLKEAIKKIIDRENMKIRVHPQDFQYMVTIKSDFLQTFDGVKNIVFEEDDSIQRGGAIIETMFGEVDARLDQQFSEIKTVMTSSGVGY
jgi:flagellar assembly protein FliH